MKIRGSKVVIALLLLGAVAGLQVAPGAPVTAARADEVAPPAAGDPTQTDRWWGWAGAVLCGGEGWLIRTNPAAGMNPYALAAGIAGCTIAILDIATT